MLMNFGKIIAYLGIAVFIAIGFSGCDNVPDHVADQCIRAQLFQQCLKTVPAGPEKTKYNDWDEVVSACGEQAYYQSIRPIGNIQPSCKP